MNISSVYVTMAHITHLMLMFANISGRLAVRGSGRSVRGHSKCGV